MVHANQDAYYKAIAESERDAQCGKFIDFMLGEIYNTLKAHQGEEIVPNKIPNKVPNKLRLQHPQIQDVAWEIYAFLKKDNTLTGKAISEQLGISDRMIRKHIATLREEGLIVREGSNKSGRWIIM